MQLPRYFSYTTLHIYGSATEWKIERVWEKETQRKRKREREKKKIIVIEADKICPSQVHRNWYTKNGPFVFFRFFFLTSVSMKLALTTIRNADIQKLTVQFVWRAGFYLRDVSKTIDRRRSWKSRQPFFFLSTAVREFVKIVDRILARGSAIKKSSSHSLGTFLHPRPPRHSRLSDVRNRERLKHKGFMRDIQANLAVNAMDQESLWTGTSLEEQSTCSRYDQSRPGFFFFFDSFLSFFSVDTTMKLEAARCTTRQRQERGMTTR